MCYFPIGFALNLLNFLVHIYKSYESMDLLLWNIIHRNLNIIYTKHNYDLIIFQISIESIKHLAKHSSF
jgi:hypothetical protein